MNDFRRIGEHLEESVASIESIILTNNSMQELGDLDVLSTLPKLETLRYLLYLYSFLANFIAGEMTLSSVSYSLQSHCLVSLAFILLKFS